MENTSRLEAVLAAHPSVDHAAVVTVPARSGGAPETVAALVAAGPTVPLAELRDHLADHLPAAEHPHGFRWLPELPRTPDGVDRQELVRSLAAWWQRAPGTPSALSADTPLAGVWWGELGRDADRSDSGHGFLNLGGHSLLAVRLIARIAEDLGVDVPLRMLLSENVSLDQLETYVADAPRTARPGEPEPALDPDLAAGPDGNRAPGTGPLTPAQRRLHLLSHVMPNPAAYNVVGSLRLAGRPDRARLDAALATVVRRHDLLRAEVGGPADGEAHLVYDRPVTPVWQTATGPEADADAFVRSIARQTILLDRAPLFRAGLLECTDSDAVYLVLSVHHMVCDQHSLDLMFAGLAAAYTGTAPPGQAPRFADHARRAVTDPDAGRGWPEDLEFWRRRLDGVPAQSGLPFAPGPPPSPTPPVPAPASTSTPGPPSGSTPCCARTAPPRPPSCWPVWGWSCRSGPPARASSSACRPRCAAATGTRTCSGSCSPRCPSGSTWAPRRTPALCCGTRRSVTWRPTNTGRRPSTSWWMPWA